jgi:uncharacterized protein YidB (DUF937 family)
MGLMDILNGMQNGPRGQRQPAPPGQSGGMSPIMMALLGLLAYKAVKGGGLENIFGGGGTPRGASPAPPPGTRSADSSGGLGDLLGGLFGGGTGHSGAAANVTPQPAGDLGSLLGGLLGGGAAGTALNGGLNNILRDLQGAGQGRVAQSWVGTGPNEEIAPDDLARAVGPDTIKALMQQTGLSRAELLEGLSDNLPDLVNQLTPSGRLPTDDEVKRW